MATKTRNNQNKTAQTGSENNTTKATPTADYEIELPVVMVDYNDTPAIMKREVTGPLLSKMPGVITIDGNRHYGYADQLTGARKVWDFHTTLKIQLEDNQNLPPVAPTGDVSEDENV